SFAFRVFHTEDSPCAVGRHVNDLFACLARPHGRMERTRQGPGDLQDFVTLRLYLAEGLRQAEFLARVMQVEGVDDRERLEFAAKRRRQAVVDLDSIGKGREA